MKKKAKSGTFDLWSKRIYSIRGQDRNMIFLKKINLLTISFFGNTLPSNVFSDPANSF